MSAACELDHLIVGAHTLEQGAAYLEELLGVKPQAGGRHLAMGTHNMVLRLGARAYLEVIALDPAGEKPPRPRWFGLDDPNTQQRLREQPRLLTWAVRTQNIDAAVKNCPLALGTVHQMSRGAFTWHITIPDDGALICDGLMPTLIQWDCDAHPADNLERRGCDLTKLEGSHSAPAGIAPALQALGITSLLKLHPAAGRGTSTLTAHIRCPRGNYRLGA
jgi:hypothetical protein